jgi:hypothetical protein
MTFTDKLKQATRKHNSLLCIGLDVDVQRIPRFLLKEKDPVGVFNKAIIEATAPSGAISATRPGCMPGPFSRIWASTP